MTAQGDGRTNDEVSAPQRKRYWIPAGRTRRHIYFMPSDDRPGLILFGLIGLGGMAATIVSLWRLYHSSDPRADRVLLTIGLGLIWLAIAQIRRLARRS
jgi:hypothetical protein